MVIEHAVEQLPENKQAPEPETGYFRSGLPYSRSGSGPLTIVIFEGLGFENKPMPRRMAAGTYRFLDEDYTIYRVTRKPGLPSGYSMQNMSDDYAAMI